MINATFVAKNFEPPKWLTQNDKLLVTKIIEKQTCKMITQENDKVFQPEL